MAGSGRNYLTNRLKIINKGQIDHSIIKMVWFSNGKTIVTHGIQTLQINRTKKPQETNNVCFKNVL